eukprot:2109359-Alexandrium_andersonii.AAC.1
MGVLHARAHVQQQVGHRRPPQALPAVLTGSMSSLERQPRARQDMHLHCTRAGPRLSPVT